MHGTFVFRKVSLKYLVPHLCQKTELSQAGGLHLHTLMADNFNLLQLQICIHSLSQLAVR